MKDCYVLMEYTNKQGLCGVSAYYSRETAYSEARDDAESIIQELQIDDYDPVLVETWDGYEVYVPDSDINYEWHIYETTIK